MVFWEGGAIGTQKKYKDKQSSKIGTDFNRMFCWMELQVLWSLRKSTRKDDTVKIFLTSMKKNCISYYFLLEVFIDSKFLCTTLVRTSARLDTKT